jgi:hypothetical protein
MAGKMLVKKEKQAFRGGTILCKTEMWLSSRLDGKEYNLYCMELESREDFMAQAEKIAHESWLDPKEVVVPAQLTSILFESTLNEHDRRVSEGISEPIFEGGTDIAHHLLHVIATSMPNNNKGLHLNLTYPERRLVLDLMNQRMLVSDSFNDYLSKFVDMMTIGETFQKPYNEGEHMFSKAKGILRRLKKGLAQKIE